MTKKHFEAFARQIAADFHAASDLPVIEERRQAEYAARYAALLVADIARQNSPRFDRERFMKACGL